MLSSIRAKAASYIHLSLHVAIAALRKSWLVMRMRALYVLLPKVLCPHLFEHLLNRRCRRHAFLMTRVQQRSRMFFNIMKSTFSAA